MTQRKCDGVLFSGNNVQKGLFHRFHVVLLKVIWLWYPGFRTAFIWSYSIKKVQILHAYCMYRAVRWGWGRSGKCASHVTQRKCDGVLFCGNCSEGIVSLFSCGFIKRYLALIPIRTAFIWSYSIKIVQKKLILHTYCMYRAGKVCGGGVGLGNAPLTWLRENAMGFCSVEIVQKGLFHRFHVVLLKVIWLWYPSGRHLYEAIS